MTTVTQGELEMLRAERERFRELAVFATGERDKIKRQLAALTAEKSCLEREIGEFQCRETALMGEVRRLREVVDQAAAVIEQELIKAQERPQP